MRVSGRGCIALATFAIALAIPAPLFADEPDTPPVEFDTNNDGKVEFTMHDRDNDGVYEWPSGTRSFPGDLYVFEPVVFTGGGTVNINSAEGIHFGDARTTPGRPLTNLALNARRFSVNLGDFAVEATNDISINAFTYVGFFGATRVNAGKTLNIKAQTADIVSFGSGNGAPGTPGVGWTFSAGNSVDIVASGREGGFDFAEVGIRSRRINIDVSNSFSGFRYFNLEDSVLTTRPERAQLTTGSGPYGGISLRGAESEQNTLRHADIDAAGTVQLRSVMPRASFCVVGGSISTQTGVIDTGGIRGQFQLRPGDQPTLYGKVVGKPPVVTDAC